MHNPTMRARILASVTICAGMMLLALAGCAPQPTPSPTPAPAFASEAEAFDAAEEVYRAYNDALNAKRGGDAEADPTAFLTGQILEEEITAAQELESAQVNLEGPTELLSFTGLRADLSGSVLEVLAKACLDISAVRAIDSSGIDVTVAGRSDVYAVEVHFTGDRDSLLISEYNVLAEVPC